LLGGWSCTFIEPRARFIMYGSWVAYTIRLMVAYIARLKGSLHYKAQAHVEAWRCAHMVLTAVLVFTLTMACLRGADRNLASGVWYNLDYEGIKTAAGSYGIAIITLVCLYSVLSYWSTSPEALQVMCVCRSDSRVSGILAGLHLIKA
jgi:hypothetical protein